MANTIDFDKVADIYDYYVAVDYDLAFYLDEIPAGPHKVLELMSGTGRVSLPLIRRGVNLTCLDYSGPMLARLAAKLRAEGLSASVVEADVRTFKLADRFDAAFIPFHSFAEIVRAEDRRLALDRINRHLRPGGTFICTLHNPAVRTGLMNGELTFRGSFPGAGDTTISLFTQERRDGAGTVHGVQYFEIHDRQGRLQDKRHLPIEFSLISAEDFLAMAVQAGFMTKALYGDYRKAPFTPESSPHIIYIMTKTADVS